MTTRAALEQLRDRLAAATGPDRTLDRDLAVVAGYCVEVINVPPGHPIFKEGGGLEFMFLPSGAMAGIPNYTASIDAAVTLVPEGWFWRVGKSTLYDGWAHLNRLHPDNCCKYDEASANAATPALALCLARIEHELSRAATP